MAPCSTNFSSIHHIRISERENIKLRKPVVEKMRRDRINSCIEQLKIILEKEFHKQEPNSKLEKADILEMTVSFLRQQLLPGLSHSDPSQGYPYYLRDSVHTLPDGSNTKSPLTLSQEKHHQTQRRTISPVCSRPRPTLKENSRDPMWRPW